MGMIECMMQYIDNTINMSQFYVFNFCKERSALLKQLNAAYHEIRRCLSHKIIQSHVKSIT